MNSTEKYIREWSKETKVLEQQHIYDSLVKKIPNGKVLEIGCGTGISTNYLLQNKHDVIVVEKLEEFAQDVKENLNVEVICANFLNLTLEQKNHIKKFMPKIVVGWFIGVDANTLIENIENGNIVLGNRNPKDILKLYREHMELKIIELSKNVFLSVNYIHFSMRIFIDEKNIDSVVNEIKVKYEQDFFNQNGFEVIELDIMNWDVSNSEFDYVNMEKLSIFQPKIVSILAKRY